MNRYALVLAACLVVMASCGGPSTSTSTPQPDPGTSTTLGGPGEPDEATLSIPCETSDDCTEDQICVDSECAIPVPAGFY
jgi:hypothetical protein